MAREVRIRTGLPCVLEVERQLEFPEPRVRVNTDPLEASVLGWNEQRGWDDLTSYYKARLG